MVLCNRSKNHLWSVSHVFLTTNNLVVLLLFLHSSFGIDLGFLCSFACIYLSIYTYMCSCQHQYRYHFVLWLAMQRQPDKVSVCRVAVQINSHLFSKQRLHKKKTTQERLLQHFFVSTWCLLGVYLVSTLCLLCVYYVSLSKSTFFSMKSTSLIMSD